VSLVGFTLKTGPRSNRTSCLSSLYPFYLSDRWGNQVQEGRTQVKGRATAPGCAGSLAKVRRLGPCPLCSGCRAATACRDIPLTHPQVPSGYCPLSPILHQQDFLQGLYGLPGLEWSHSRTVDPHLFTPTVYPSSKHYFI
jgi:hypothetical protein